MPKIEAEFEVYCSCGEGLCQQTSAKPPSSYGFSTGIPGIIIKPCEKCIQKAYDDGYNQAEVDNDI